MSNINHNAVIRLTQQGQERAMDRTDSMLHRFNNQPMSIRQYSGIYGTNEGVVDIAIRQHIADGNVYFPGGSGGGGNFLGNLMNRPSRPAQVLTDTSDNE